MTVRGATALKAFFQTGDVPTQSNFEDWFDSIELLGDMKGVVPLKKFGLSMSDYTAADSDQLTAFQAAINSAAGSGDVILLPGGKLVLDGLLQVPTIGGFIGSSMYHTHIKLADGANSQLIACNDPNTNSTGNATGGLANIIANVTFNGNKNNNTHTGSLVYSYSGATGLPGQTDFVDVLGQPRNFVDPRRLWQNIHIVDSPGIGFETDGRGESRYINIFVREAGGNGFKFGTFDEFAMFLTAAAPGGVGFEFASGASQFRLVASKAYFTGSDATRSDGDGFACTAGGVQNLQIIGCTAQDTHRHGFNLQGTLLDLVGCQCESIGTGYPVFANGNSTVNGDITAVYCSALKDSRIQMTIADRQAAAGSATAYCEWGVDLRSNTQLCEFDIKYGTSGTYVELAKEVRTNNLSTGMRNWVKMNGEEVYGYAFTAAELGAATHGVNVKAKRAGTRVFDSTNNKIRSATGTSATSTWVDAVGADAITPA